VTETASAAVTFGRVERYPSTGSTNDLVRAWLADGTPEICVAVADEQTGGRGRNGRTWTAPRGTALLASLGFRPTWLEPDRTWRLAATVALAMCDAAEDVAGLPTGSIRLKWPNDLVVETGGPRALITGEHTAPEVAATLAGPLELCKLAGVLGESDGLGTPDPQVVVGIGINADWAREDFPAELADGMTSLRDASGGRPIDREALLASFLERVEGRIEALRAGFFDVADWAERQATTGRVVGIDTGDGAGNRVLMRAVGVDAHTGALVLEDEAAPGGERHVHAGDVLRVRLAPGV
jgi:BirA family transcriptional regulator, biotin operon repressor / biotin---[acetyl-CoA-carboxylase] ligase